MTEIRNTKYYDLEDRTYNFSKRVRKFVRQLPKITANFEDGKQVIRSSGSVGANYIEANEALSKKDCLHRLKISRKESKESRYWLRLINIEGKLNLKKEQEYLINEATELMNIFGSIVRNMEDTRKKK